MEHILRVPLCISCYVLCAKCSTYATRGRINVISPYESLNINIVNFILGETILEF